MRKKSFSQTYTNAMKLEQIRQYDPAAYAEIIGSITGTLTRIAASLRPQPVPQPNYITDLADILPLFRASLDKAKPGKDIRIATTPWGPVSIHWPSNEKWLRLIIRNPTPTTSKPLARFGFDETNISGRAGCWKLADGVERLFQEWIERVQR